MVRNQVLATVAAGAVAGAAILYLLSQQKDRAGRRAAALDEEQLAELAREYYSKQLDNTMISFKHDFPNASFDEFVLAMFPENAQQSPTGEILVDSRMRNDAWEGRFHRLKATSRPHNLGKFPECS
eukprot:c15700_g1_i1.p1 GENE.c15700_g1_i1~~c15700_g1_i1.p1  ORF type:complete len:137 (-),score=26.93 c15700_g1_i1:295-672(-)